MKQKAFARLALAFGGVLLTTACVSMPSAGPVTEVNSDGSTRTTPGYSFDPKPPQGGESAAEIVSNFLDAMKAIPSRMNVAREFLTPEAQQRWTPERGVMTYDELGDPAGEESVVLAMSGIETYDARGAWQHSRAVKVVEFDLTLRDGEWRIDDLPDALVVPESWFEEQFRRMSLYYFDPTAQILVPEPVFVPADDDQLASALVAGLLDDPTADPRITRTFVPPGFKLGLSVPITSAGVAEVTLVGDAATIDPEASDRILTQLIWTLRQESQIQAVLVSIGEDEPALSGESTQVNNLDIGNAFDPTGARSSGDLFGLVDGLVVRGSIDSMLPTPGPMGTDRLGIRSIGVSLDGERVAGVSGDGRSLLVAPMDGAGRAVEVASGGRDLLPPAWDFMDRIWLADRAAGGAVISVVAGDQPPRAIEVPGMSGRDIRRLLVSRDGSRLVAVVRTSSGDRIVASRILHSDSGKVLRATRAVTLDFAPDPIDKVIRDIGWRSPTSISVLTDLTPSLSQVATISVDGSPGNLGIAGATSVSGGTRQLVSSPVEGAEVFAISPQSVSDLTAPARPIGPLPDGLSSLTYVG